MFWAFGGGGRRAAAEAPPPSTPSPRPQRRAAEEEEEEEEEEAPVAAASLFESDAFFRLGRVLSQQQQSSTPLEGQVRGSGVGWDFEAESGSGGFRAFPPKQPTGVPWADLT